MKTAFTQPCQVALSEGMRADSTWTAGTDASDIRSTSLSAPVQLRSFSQINQVFVIKAALQRAQQGASDKLLFREVNGCERVRGQKGEGVAAACCSFEEKKNIYNLYSL